MAEWKTDKPVIKREDVLMVYTGKRGCMCGCNGNYRYPKANAELGKRQRGYDIKPEELNDAQVTRVLKRMATLDGVEVAEIYGKDGDSLYYGWEDPETHRVVFVYTKPGAPYVKPAHLNPPDDPYKAAMEMLKNGDSSAVV
jgi:hypothetical protein